MNSLETPVVDAQLEELAAEINDDVIDLESEMERLKAKAARRDQLAKEMREFIASALEPHVHRIGRYVQEVENDFAGCKVTQQMKEDFCTLQAIYLVLPYPD